MRAGDKCRGEVSRSEAALVCVHLSSSRSFLFFHCLFSLGLLSFPRTLPPLSSVPFPPAKFVPPPPNPLPHTSPPSSYNLPPKLTHTKYNNLSGVCEMSCDVKKFINVGLLKWEEGRQRFLANDTPSLLKASERVATPIDTEASGFSPPRICCSSTLTRSSIAFLWLSLSPLFLSLFRKSLRKSLPTPTVNVLLPFLSLR